MTDFAPQDRRDEDSWHLKKEINVSLIISVISIAVAAVTGYTDLKRDIALIQADIVVLHQSDTRQVADSNTQLGVIRTQYERLEAKLDRLIERSVK